MGDKKKPKKKPKKKGKKKPVSKVPSICWRLER